VIVHDEDPTLPSIHEGNVHGLIITRSVPYKLGTQARFVQTQISKRETPERDSYYSRGNYNETRIWSDGDRSTYEKESTL